MPRLSLTILSVVSLLVGIGSALWIAFDIVVARHRQQMAVMNFVWPVTALYASLLALALYYRYGRQRTRSSGGERRTTEKPFWATVVVGVSHCGAGCTLGDVVGATLVAVLGLQIAGIALWPEYLVEFAIAYSAGVVFQYFAIVPMRGLRPRAGLVAAARADTFSLLAFEVGMFAWMAVVQLVFFSARHLHPTQPTYWFLMQIAMVLGCITAFPANWWLIRHGVKEAM